MEMEMETRDECTEVEMGDKCTEKWISNVGARFTLADLKHERTMIPMQGRRASTVLAKVYGVSPWACNIGGHRLLT